MKRQVTAIIIYITIITAIVILYINGGNIRNTNRKNVCLSNAAFQDIQKQSPSANTIYSPLSLDLTLAMLKEGASGDTLLHIDKVLGGKDMATIYKNVKSYGSTKMSNSIWAGKDMVYSKGYSDALQNKYDAEAKTVDFADNVNAANEINSYVGDKTENMITRLIDENSINESTKLVIVNTVYFHGKWAEPFPTKDTHQGIFNNSDGTQSNIDMMHGDVDQSFEYADGDMYGVMKKYEDGCKFIAARNVDGTGIDTSQMEFDTMVKASISNNGTCSTELSMPKFEATTLTDANTLRKTLTDAGAKDMFTDKAQFDRISADDIRVSKIIQKAHISINENETIAAAATETSTLIGHMPTSVPKIVSLDCPFLYAITDADNNIIFEGYFQNAGK